MMKKFRKFGCVCLSILMMLSLMIPVQAAEVTDTEAGQEETAAEAEELIKELINYYGYYQEDAAYDIDRVLGELKQVDEEKAEAWTKIMDFWSYANTDMEVNRGVLPDGLSNEDDLCIVVLGFQLNPDGTMKDELIGRLEVALASAKKYPNAYVACTGGGTAAENPDKTEADQMAAWLIENGVEEDRIIVENKSKSTVENAEFTYAILREDYPEIDSLCMVTSDYHVPRGSILYFSRCLLSAYEAGDKQLEIVSNAGYETGREGYETYELQAAGVAQVAGVTLDAEAPAPVRTQDTLIEQLIQYYGHYQEKANTDILRVLEKLAEVDEEEAEAWAKIMDFWSYANTDMEVNKGVLPDGLSNEDDLCIVVLGFQLNPDGTMKDELIGRLEVALASAKKYPNAYVACTGGGTAAENPDKTEADQMAAWLMENGVDKDRIIVENKSKSTVENAEFTYAILREDYPEIDSLCMVTSDYHVPRGSILYFSRCLLSAYEAGDKQLEIVSNAGYETGREGYETYELQAAGVAQVAGIPVDMETKPELSVVEEIEYVGDKEVIQNGFFMIMPGELVAKYDSGYEREVVLDDSTVVQGEIDSKVLGKQKIKVEYTENDVTVSTEFDVEVIPMPFDDVKEGDWYADYVVYTHSAKIMRGLNDTTFDPMGGMLRAQFAKVLYNMEGTPFVKFEEKFPDVREDDWYASAVTWAYQNGIVTGYDDTGLFGAMNTVTRQELVTMVYRHAGMIGLDVEAKGNLDDFADAGSVSEYAKEAMEWAVEAEIIEGDGITGNIMPLKVANRAEAAAIMTRYIAYIFADDVE